MDLIGRFRTEAAVAAELEDGEVVRGVAGG